MELITGRNLIPFPYHNKLGFTADGITWTVNADQSVTANGTAALLTRFVLFYKAQNIIKNSTNFMISGCPQGGGYGTYRIGISAENHGTNTWAFDIAFNNGDITSFSTASDVESYDITASIYIQKGATVPNITFYPMLEVGAVAHPYEPYIVSGTNWVATDYFNAVDYNRIKRNINLIKALADELFHGFPYITDMGSDKTYESLFYAREMNAIENNLALINLNSYGFDIGNTTSYSANGSTPLWSEYNRLESAILLLYNTMIAQRNALPRLALRLGNQKGLRV